MGPLQSIWNIDVNQYYYKNPFFKFDYKYKYCFEMQTNYLKKNNFFLKRSLIAAI